jgi:Alr-MurF fusion protein
LKYSIGDIAAIVNGKLSGSAVAIIDHLLIDSRRIVFPSSSLFFALITAHRDGHRFIGDAYKKGVRNFIVSEHINADDYPEVSFVFVADTRSALQQLAANHRRQFSIPTIGITGSNGKTIVKEWLYQLLHFDYNIVRSPRSFNSQVGVPLSVWQMNAQHQLAIFEAGISLPDEMEKLEAIIQPTIGILTNIGEAHSEGFADRSEKLEEKVKLFIHCDTIIVNGDDEEILGAVSRTGKKILTWGNKSTNKIQMSGISKGNLQTEILLTTLLPIAIGTPLTISIPFTDDASVENAITCCSIMLHLGIKPSVIKERMLHLQPVNMRLEMKKGINNCVIINDSYSADLSSLHIALSFLQQQSGVGNKTVILSDFLQSGTEDKILYEQIAHLLLQHNINRLIGIGEKISHHLAVLLEGSSIRQDYYLRMESFLQQFLSSLFKDETILVKGARKFEFEQITQLLSQKVHQTRLEINLDAIVHNLKEYRKFLKPGVKVMAMVKAFAYGSGGAEIAGVLQYHGADYLGVAYADEGVELRKAGIQLPVMVMNPEETSFDVLIENNLEPEIFSFDLLKKFDTYLRSEGLQQYPIHLEIETGMNRLGFGVNEIDELGICLSNTASFKIQSVFSHLAAAEEAVQDEYTLQQNEKFITAANRLEKKLGYPFLKHIANSAAIVRHPQLHYDMVRPGIGLYGVDSSGIKKLNLQPVATLKATIAQIKKLKPGESVSYNRKGKIEKESIIATVRIGYADGYPRRLGNGIGKMMVKGKLASVIGAVCMDMVMLDMTDIKDIKEGDEVIIFGKELSVEQLAVWSGTIPYEIMTGVSQRVKRVYFQE